MKKILIIVALLSSGAILAQSMPPTFPVEMLQFTVNQCGLVWLTVGKTLQNLISTGLEMDLAIC